MDYKEGGYANEAALRAPCLLADSDTSNAKRKAVSFGSERAALTTCHVNIHVVVLYGWLSSTELNGTVEMGGRRLSWHLRSRRQSPR